MSEKFKTVAAPAKPPTPKFERVPEPQAFWYQFFDYLTRRDEILLANLQALNVIIEQNNAVIQLLGYIPEALGVGVPGISLFKDYLTEDQLDRKGLVNEANPVLIEVLEIMGRRAKYGYVYSETGTINVKINDGAPIPVKAADFLPIFDLNLEIEKMRIETTSAVDLSFRLLLV